jgi:hypothetical protein
MNQTIDKNGATKIMLQSKLDVIKEEVIEKHKLKIGNNSKT